MWTMNKSVLEKWGGDGVYQRRDGERGDVICKKVHISCWSRRVSSHDLLLCVLTILCETHHFKTADVSLMCLLPRNWCLGEVLCVLISLTGSFCNVPISQNCSSFIYRKHIVSRTRKQSRGEEINSCMSLSTSRENEGVENVSSARGRSWLKT